MADKKINDELGDMKKVRLNEYVTLGTLCKIISGGTPDTKNNDYWNGNIEWFTPTEIGTSKYVYNSKRKISEAGLKNSSAKIIPANSILLTTRATIGNVSINKIECTTNQGFQNIYPNNIEQLDYLYYCLEYLKEKMNKYASGSTFNEISGKEVQKLLIKKIPISDSVKFGKLLSSIDDLIKQSTQLEQLYTLKKNVLLKTIFNEDSNDTNWFTNKIKLGDHVEFLNGLKGMSSKNFESDNPNSKYIQFKNIHTSTINESELGDVSIDDVAKQSRVLKNDLLITGSSENFEEVGTTNINKLDLDNLFVNSFSYIMRTIDIDPLYLHYLLKAPASRRKIILQGQGITRINLSPSRVSNMFINVHNDDVQNNISKLFSTIDELIVHQKNITNEYKNLKKYHLNNIFK